MLVFARSSLSRQFLLISFPVLLAGMLVIGYLIGNQVEENVAESMGGVSGLYVDSFVAPHVQSLLTAQELSEAEQRALGKLLTETQLGKRIVAFKVWRRDGRILYSADASQIGKFFPLGEGLTEALAGRVHSEISKLSAEENALEVRKFSRLVETYVPIHAAGVGKVIAVAEFYQPVDEVMHASAAAQRESWLVVGVTTLVMFLLLFVLVRRGSQTIEHQRRELHEKISQLIALNSQNELLHDRVRRAAASTTALNETYLRRISADLHDGPGQDLGFALMRFETVTEELFNFPASVDGPGFADETLRPIRAAIASALADLRLICNGLQLPELEPLTLGEIAARAVRDFESKTGVKVAVRTGELGRVASLPVKIALYRLLQEALANGFRHAGGKGQRVELKLEGARLEVVIGDNGPGFDPQAAVREGQLGLRGMRERVEVLGGTFGTLSRSTQGTVIRVSLPLVVPEMKYD
ncbi:sensor histidine kinase [Rhodoferax koreense]|uniref:sensor histidine kinase n=1 Tax=Rhodoferax koreensis TaxID=1842727 RepID=UPI0009F8442E|nr:sensor histidine kinase [Rhodoferax koreense]